jgi:hypothetical protein
MHIWIIKQLKKRMRLPTWVKTWLELQWICEVGGIHNNVEYFVNCFF